MRVFQRSAADQWRSDAAALATGAVVGLGAGMLVSMALRKPRRLQGEIRERMLDAVRRLRPARLRRLRAEQDELDWLEDLVLNAFLGDAVLCERAVDIGAISPGIVELSGVVASEVEGRRARDLANRVPGVLTVVNRITVGETGRAAGIRRRLAEDEIESTFAHQEGRVGGMGRRRQSPVTDPDRRDDSQRLRESALAAADREQWSDEGYAPLAGRDGDTGGPGAARTRFREHELDNQDPHDQHAERTPDSPPRELHSQARVGEGMKPGIKRLLERADDASIGPSGEASD